MKRNVPVPARLDPDGTEKPLTRIIHHPNTDHCIDSRVAVFDPEIETVATGERVKLLDPKGRFSNEEILNFGWSGEPEW